MKKEVRLSEKAVRCMRTHIMTRYPNEACGVLIGDAEGKRIEEIYIAGNVERADRTKDTFCIDPMEVYRIEKEIEGRGSILGFYHSHPDKPAVPSKKDVRHMIPGMLTLIWSVTESGCDRVAGYEKIHPEQEAYEEVTVK